MTKQEKEAELNKAVELLENDDLAEQHDEELYYITERLCEMQDKDYRRFLRYMRNERRARKHLGSMSFYA